MCVLATVDRESKPQLKTWTASETATISALLSFATVCRNTRSTLVAMPARGGLFVSFPHADSTVLQESPMAASAIRAKGTFQLRPYAWTVESCSWLDAKTRLDQRRGEEDKRFVIQGLQWIEVSGRRERKSPLQRRPVRGDYTVGRFAKGILKRWCRLAHS